jgi:hypothetical protein
MPMPSMPGGQHFEHPVDDRIAGVHHLELGLVLAAAALGRDVDMDVVALDHFDRKHARGVVARVAAGERGIGQDRGTQLVLGIQIGAAHAFIDHVLQRLVRLEPAVLPPLDEHVDDAGVLADRAVPFGAHPAVGEDLRDRVLGGGALFGLVSHAQRANVVHRVEVADVLQRVGHALDQVFLADRNHFAHGGLPPAKLVEPCGGKAALLPQ